METKHTTLNKRLFPKLLDYRIFSWKKISWYEWDNFGENIKV